MADDRNLTRAALTLITIAWRLLDSPENEEETDEPNSGLRSSVD